MEKAVAFLRVTSGAIKPFTFRANCNPPIDGEAMEFKATGHWMPEDEPSFSQERYPTSLHFTVPIGIGLIPPTGDFLKITIETANVEETKKQRYELGY